MLNSITIENFKSIKKLELELGRINVFIGENGAGKSNILEAIVFAGAALSDKLDNEFLASRGIRVTSHELMRSAFPIEGEEIEKQNDKIAISVSEGKKRIDFDVISDDAIYPKWLTSSFLLGDKKFITKKSREELINSLEKLKSLKELQDVSGKDLIKEDFDALFNRIFTAVSEFELYTQDNYGGLGGFIIFSPENTALRAFEKEGQIQPLGINGEGLFKLIKVISNHGPELLNSISDQLKVLGWFSGFNLNKDSLNHSDLLEVEDRYLCDEAKVLLDQRSVNEGFLFLLFYFVLFSSELTPSFFAIDNIDASLNPKLCQKLMVELNKLAVEHNKQAILTTHNPAILDGLNLDDDDQRLFVVSRREDGSTRVRRIKKPKAKDGQILRLSEMFMRGTLGGLPEGF